MLINGCVCKGETVAVNGPDFACRDGGRQAQLPPQRNPQSQPFGVESSDPLVSHDVQSPFLGTVSGFS